MRSYTSLLTLCLSLKAGVFSEQTVIDQAHLLHEREEWNVEATDAFGAVTETPEMFEKLVSQSARLIKEALLREGGEDEEDILAHESAHGDLEVLVQNVLSSFAFALENAAVENYRWGHPTKLLQYAHSGH